MKRYIFLLLAFFLCFNTYADGLGLSSSMSSVSAVPTGLSREKGNTISRKVANTVKETSPRNGNEMGETQQTSKDIPVNAATNKIPNLSAKKGKTASSDVSCKTYEGNVYGKGEAGYNDCIRTIKTDRQKATTIP